MITKPIIMKINNCLLLIFTICLLSCKNSDFKKENSQLLNPKQQSIENTTKEICSLIKVILDDEKVKCYIHFEKDSIFYIYNNSVLTNYPIDLNDNKYILTNEVNENMNYIEFTSIIFEKKDYTYLISFNIPKQGVIGNVILKKNNNKLYVYKDSIFEH